MKRVFILLAMLLHIFLFSFDAYAHMVNPYANSYDNLKNFVKYPLFAFFIFGLVSAAFFFYGLKRRKDKPEKVKSNKAIFFFGVLFTTLSLLCLGLAVDACQGIYYPSFILFSAIVYGILGIALRSKGAWVMGMLSLGIWFIAQTDYVGDRYKLFLGMNCPLRFAVFGVALTGSSFLMKKTPKLKYLFRPTYAVGLLYLFIALLALSIVGNSVSGNVWELHDLMKQSGFFPWGFLFTASAFTAIFYGRKYGDSLSKGFGIAFLLMYLYSIYFKYFWTSLHKTVFFAILVSSLLLLGFKFVIMMNPSATAWCQKAKERRKTSKSMRYEKVPTAAALASLIGFIISLLAALISWIPFLGAYGVAGLIGASICFAAVWSTHGWARVVAVLGMLIGLGAAGAGIFWWYLLKHSGGHLF